jgi:hypothetical protein
MHVRRIRYVYAMCNACERGEARGLTLGAAREDANAATDLGVATDDGVEAAFFCFGSHILGILLERLEPFLGAARVDLLAAADLLRGSLDRFGSRSRLFQDVENRRVLHASEDQVVLGDKAVVLKGRRDDTCQFSRKFAGRHLRRSWPPPPYPSRNIIAGVKDSPYPS